MLVRKNLVVYLSIMPAIGGVHGISVDYSY